jgi:BirA family biotin operon repressor/biotin-[acetyl-CoA-carboxylase] ligase
MHTIYRFDTLDSTMTKAAELAAAGAESGTVIVAREQTAGQGRLGRSWHSEPDTGLYVTEILRPKLCPDSLPVVTLALGLATVDAITETAGVACDLRWPNDVIAGDKKVAGILAQLQQGALLAGIGVNVNQISMPEDLQDIAASLRCVTGREHSCEALLHTLIDRIDGWLETLLRDGKRPVLDAFTQTSSYVRGRRVIVDVGDGEIRGVTDGLDPQGFLYVRQDDGRRTLILAGGVRPADS